MAASNNTIELINAMLKYYGIAPNPDELDEDEWFLQYALLEKIRTMENKSN